MPLRPLEQRVRAGFLEKLERDFRRDTGVQEREELQKDELWRMVRSVAENAWADGVRFRQGQGGR